MDSKPPTDQEVQEDWDYWVALYANRDDLAWDYAKSLHTISADSPQWREMNAAILRRWSPSALRYIKEKAWKIARI